MNKLIESGSSIFLFIFYLLLYKCVNLEYSLSIILLFISSVLYHSKQIKLKKMYFNHNIYISDEKNKFHLYFYRFCISYIFLQASGILNNYSIIYRIILCLSLCHNKKYNGILIGSSIFLSIPYLSMIPYYQSCILLSATISLILMQTCLTFFTLPIKYIWHFVCSLIVYYEGIITIIHPKQKTLLYVFTNQIVIISYIILIINYALYHHSFSKIKINDSDK